MPKKRPRKPAPDANESAYSVVQQIIRKTEAPTPAKKKPKKKAKRS